MQILFQLEVLFISLCMFHISNTYSSSCSAGYLLQYEIDLNSVGCAGIEQFAINNVSFLAIANFWDGLSSDMSAMSTLHQLSSAPDSSLETRYIHGFNTKGAHGMDYFTHDEKHFLVVPNYYGCEHGNQRAVDCQSTMVYLWHPESSRFEFFQHIATAGSAQTDHFLFHDDQYLVVAENFAGIISVHQLTKTRDMEGPSTYSFKKVQDLECAGTAAVALETLDDGSILLIGASYHDHGWQTRSHVYLMKPEQSSFHRVQLLDTQGAHDVEMIRYQGAIYLFISEDRSDESSSITSGLWRWEQGTILSQNGEIAESYDGFVLKNRVNTVGAHAAEFFILDDRLFLAVANFGDRHHKRIDTDSMIYELVHRDDGVDVVNACSVPSHGATDWEYFMLDGKSYLALSNEGDFDRIRNDENYQQHSKLYQFSLG
jgi:hypothetical protein